MATLEQKLKAKVPGEDTGIEIKKTVCDICAPDHHCGIDAYVKDGRILKVEGSPDHPYSRGNLCTKGLCSRQYVYREDRIKTPMKRVGPRGSGQLEPISWDEAYRTIAENLNRVKEEYSPHQVAFYSGHAKWHRPMMQRLAYDFGSVNYGSDCSFCNLSLIFARIISSGCNYFPDIAHANTFLGWAFGGYYSSYQDVLEVAKLKERGGKVIIIDTRITPASKKLADIFLQIKPGTDGALAHGFAKVIIDNDWIDHDFVENHTFGLEEYKAYIQQFDLETVSRITGAPAELIYEAAKLYATNGPACIYEICFNLAHNYNGHQNYRAITCLNALTGNFDRTGGALPAGPGYNMRAAGIPTRESAFSCANKPDYPRLGEGRFPIWDLFWPEFQASSMVDQMLSGEPYPIRALYAAGLNVRTMPDTQRTLDALMGLDFFVNVDLFMTEAAKYADIVLPACTSFERGELKVYPGGYAMMTKPVIEPLYESKNDVQIYSELLPYLGIKDELLERGYDACIDWILEGTGLSADYLRRFNGCIRPKCAQDYVPGSYVAGGMKTPSGKWEFKSNIVGKFTESHGLNALPTYVDCFADDASPDLAEKYPYILSTGTRISSTIHSRLHEVPWARSLRPEPALEISTADAADLNVREGDWVEVSTPTGKLRMKVKISGKIQPGNVHLVHGYRECDSSRLIDSKHLDYYSGFPCYRTNRCIVRKIEV